jgi:hypothetical protein
VPDAPSLVIPVRLDSIPAEHGLQKLGAAGDKAGEQVKRGADDAGKGLKGAAQDAASMASAIGAVSVAGVGLSQLKSVVGGMLTYMKEVSDNAHRMAKDFIQTQQAMQGIAAISGKGNTNQFAIEEVRKGASANLTPAEWTSFRNAFLSGASNYIGEGASSKLNTADADEYQRSLAEYAKLHGVAAGDMASFGSGLLAQEAGPTTAAAMKTKAGKVFATLEASSAKVSHLLPFMTSTMAQGVTAEEAAPTLSMLPEIAPNEEGTHLLRVLTEIRKANLKGKGKDFGLSPEMGMQQQLEAVVGNLRGRSDKGENLDKMLVDLTEESIAQNTLRGLVRQGPKGFAQWQSILKKTSPTAIDEDIAFGRKTESGQVMHAQAQLALAEAERGKLRAPVEVLRMEAQAQLTKESRLDETHLTDFIRKPLTIFGTGINDQLINERALTLAQDRARIPQVARETIAPGARQEVADAAILRVLQRQTQLMEDEAKGKTGKPLVVQQPGTGGARMNGG